MFDDISDCLLSVRCYHNSLPSSILFKSIPVLKNKTSPVVWNQVSFCCIDSMIVEKDLWSGMSFASICCERTFLPSQHWIL